MENYLFLIPLVPLLSAIIIGLFGNNLKRSVVNFISPFAVFISFILSVMALNCLNTKGTPLIQNMFLWIDLPMLQVDMAFYFDELTAVMALVVTGVAFLIPMVFSPLKISNSSSFSQIRSS